MILQRGMDRQREKQNYQCFGKAQRREWVNWYSSCCARDEAATVGGKEQEAVRIVSQPAVKTLQKCPFV